MTVIGTSPTTSKWSPDSDVKQADTNLPETGQPGVGGGLFDPIASQNPPQNPPPHAPPVHTVPSRSQAPYVEHHSPDDNKRPLVSDSKVVFHHPVLGTLETDYGINEITWSYKLNVRRFPTYAGEVVQILSVYIDDVLITGQIATYRQMELIFAYFAAYMEIATQGAANTELGDLLGNRDALGQHGTGQGSQTDTAYNEVPIEVSYPQRGWDFYIQPKSMAGFRYGREVVAPEWQIQAAVFDTSVNLERAVSNVVQGELLGDLQAGGIYHPYVNPGDQNPGASRGKDDPSAGPYAKARLDDMLDQSGNLQWTLTGQIGFNPNNPFSNPFPQEGITGTFNTDLTHPAFQSFGKYYADLVSSYANTDFNDLFNQFGSGPAPTTNNQSGQKNTTATKK